LANPGPQASLAGSAASSVTLSGKDATSGQTLTYSATGLPAGLSISSAGVISGTPTTNGTSTVTVTAKDGNGAATAQSFVWTVAPGTASGTASPAGPVTAYEGLCLDDRSASTALYNPIQVYTCNGTNAQQWTPESNGTLEVLGLCLDVDAAGTANGTLVDLYTCNGTGAQQWQAQANGELVNPESGKCLDDTGFGGAGTQVQIWTCADSANQQWTLPNVTPPTGNAPNLGSNVYVFTTAMSTTTIQNDINQVYATQQSNQFGTQRYELMFEPGTYNVTVPVGFYTEVVGLGQSPTQTVITGGGIYANAAW